MISYEYECRTCGMTHFHRKRDLEGSTCAREGCAGTIRRVLRYGFQAMRGH
jgi:hypothetical protein